MRIFPMAIVLLVSAASLPAKGWSLHYLVTDRALSHPSMENLAVAVQAEPLEVFLVSQREPLSRVFADFYSWLGSTGSTRFNPRKFDPAKPDIEEFLKAARLNPATRFYLVDRVMPDATPQSRELSQAEIEKVVSEKIQFKIQMDDVSDQKVSARSVLRTFSDEPDWGMDRGLWEIAEYGYGEMPYGSKTGIASQAAFHMQFLHENILVKTFAPEMLDGMAMERVELFSRLAKLAFSSGHPYWGFRFSAWVTHYLQDICQPYHAKAVPHGDLWYYLRFIFSTEKEKFKRETTQLVKNRHFAYEDFVAHGLKQSYLRPEPIYQKLADFLSADQSGNTDLAMGVREPRELFLWAAERAAKHAHDIDQAVVAAFGAKLTSDPAYDLESDATYSIQSVIDHLTPESQQRILSETGTDFTRAGAVTRSLVRALSARE